MALYQGVKIEITTSGDTATTDVLSSIEAKSSTLFTKDGSSYLVTINDFKFKMSMYEPQHFEVELSINGKPDFSQVRQNLVGATAKIIFAKTNADPETISTSLFIYKATPKYTKNKTTIVTLDVYSYDKLLDLQKFNRVYTGARFGKNILSEVPSFDKPVYGLKVSMNPRIMSYQIPEADDKGDVKPDGTLTDCEIIQPYTVQYNETYRSMINRVANRCGEFLYWHLDSLQYGLHKDAESNTTTLTDEMIDEISEAAADIDNFKAFTVVSNHRDGSKKIDKPQDGYIDVNSKNNERAYENEVGNAEFSSPVNNVAGPREGYKGREYRAIVGLETYTDKLEEDKLDEDGNVITPKHDIGDINWDKTDHKKFLVGMLSKFVNTSTGFIDFVTNFANDLLVDAPLGQLAKLKKIDIEKKKLNLKPIEHKDRATIYPFFNEAEQTSYDNSHKNSDDDYTEWGDVISHFSTCASTKGTTSVKAFNASDFVDSKIVLTDGFYTEINKCGKKAAEGAIDVNLTVTTSMMNVGDVISYNQVNYIVTKVDGEFTTVSESANKNEGVPTIRLTIHAIPVTKKDSKDYYLPEPLEQQFRKMDGNSTAVITDVDDPYGQERVRVRFTWQEKNAVQLTADETKACHEKALDAAYGGHSITEQHQYEIDLSDTRCANYIASIARDIRDGNKNVGTIPSGATKEDDYLVNMYKTNDGTWHTWYAYNWLETKDKNDEKPYTCKLGGFKTNKIKTEPTESESAIEINDHKLWYKNVNGVNYFDSEAARTVNKYWIEKSKLNTEISNKTAEIERLDEQKRALQDGATNSIDYWNNVKSDANNNLTNVLPDKKTKKEIERANYIKTVGMTGENLENAKECDSLITKYTNDIENLVILRDNTTIPFLKQQYQEEIDALEGKRQTEIGKREEIQKAVEAEITKFDKDLIDIDKQVAEQVLMKDKADEEIEKLKAERDELDKQISKLAKEIEELETKVFELDNKIIDPRGEVENFSTLFKPFEIIECYNATYRKEIEEAKGNKAKLQNCADSTPWIRMASPMAGKDNFMKMLPSVNTEVIIGFENGNIERPYVLGSLFQKGGCSLTGYYIGKNSYGEYTPMYNGDYRIIGANGQGLTMTDENIGWSDIFSMAGLPVFSTLTSTIPTLTAGSGIEGLGNLTKSIDSDKSMPIGGSISLKDKYGFYNLTMSSANRKVSISSPMGTIALSAFQGISISCPNGDVTINGKNITLKAGDKLTLISGTNKNNLDTTSKDIAGAVGKLLAKMAVTAVTSFIGTKAVDLTNLRSVWEVVFKPLNGTMSLTSNRHMLIQAGKGKAEMPVEAMRAYDPSTIVNVFPNYPYFLLSKLTDDWANEIVQKHTALNLALDRIDIYHSQHVRLDVDSIDVEDGPSMSNYGKAVKKRLVDLNKLSESKLKHIMQKCVKKGQNGWEVETSDDTICKFCPYPSSLSRNINRIKWKETVKNCAQMFADLGNAYEKVKDSKVAEKSGQKIADVLNKIKKSKHIATDIKFDDLKKAFRPFESVIVTDLIANSSKDFNLSEYIGSSASPTYIKSYLVGSSSILAKRRLNYEILKAFKAIGVIAYIDKSEELKVGKKRYKLTDIPAWISDYPAGPEGYRLAGEKTWEDFINHCVPASSVESDSPLWDAFTSAMGDTVLSTVDGFFDWQDINWMLNQERNIWDTSKHDGLILISQEDGKTTGSFQSDGTIKWSKNNSISAILKNMKQTEPTTAMTPKEKEAQNHTIFDGDFERWTKPANLTNNNIL